MTRLRGLSTRLAKKRFNNADRQMWLDMKQELALICRDAAKDDDVALVIAMLEASKGRFRMPQSEAPPARKRRKSK